MSELSKVRKDLKVAEDSYEKAQSEYVKWALFGSLGLSSAERQAIDLRYKQNIRYWFDRVNKLKAIVG